MRALRIGIVSYSVAFLGTILWLVAALGLSGCAESTSGIGSARYVKEFDWEFDARDTTRLDVDTVNGSIDVAGNASTDTIRIHARMEVRAPSEAAAREFAEKVLVKAEQDGSRVRAFRKFPRPPVRTSVSVTFTVDAPERLDVELTTTNGSVTAKGLVGAARLHSTNGSIDLVGSDGPFDLATTNGDVKAVLARMVEKGRMASTNGSIRCTVQGAVTELDLTTTNGSIDLTVPPDTAGTLDARTTHGSVSSEIPVAVTEAKKQLVGPFGGGGPAKITARTTNGNVRITTTP